MTWRGLKIHYFCANVNVAIHNTGFSGHHVAIRFDDVKLIAVSVTSVIGVETLCGIVHSLMRSIKNALLFVVDGDGVEIEPTSSRLIGLTTAFQFLDENVKLAGIVAGIVYKRRLNGVDRIVVGTTKSPGNLDVIGIRLGINQTINNSCIFIISININISAT